MKIFYKIENGKLRVAENADDKAAAPEGYTETETDNAELYKHDGEKAEFFDENMRRIPDEILIEQGKRIDRRGIWFNRETRETKRIHNIDEAIDETEYTKDQPLENEPYQLFDRQKNKWVVDAEKKERAEKENRLGRIKAEIADAERRQIRPLKAIFKNEADNKDIATFDHYEDIIQTLRPQVTALENELKSA